jgi:hypothetical protein
MDAATVLYCLYFTLSSIMGGGGVLWRSETEFLDVIGTKVLRVFFLAIHSHLKWILFPPSPLGKSGLKLVGNVKLYTETSSQVGTVQCTFCIRSPHKCLTRKSCFNAFGMWLELVKPPALAS